MADHPRSRGVYVYVSLGNMTLEGSSPLARGLRETPPRRRCLRRIIPARAGFTFGEVGDGLSLLGSSPLARGLPLRRRRLPGHQGIIPARAGFTPRRPSARQPRPDHPRSRGVYVGVDHPHDAGEGSSPLARGLRRRTLRRLVRLRIIPARAGFTLRSWTRPARPPDHPRSRGVYPTSTTRSSPKGGSSPLARGLLSSASGRVRQMGSSPLARGLLSSASGRVRQMGSSPLARGLQHPRPLGRVQHGIIPARAGFTIGAPSVVVVCPDHPRSRGVYSSDRDDQGSARGSSPLARGLRRV